MGKFDVFKEINTIDALAGGDILKWEQVMKLTYADVYVKLLKNKMEAEYQKKYQYELNKKYERQRKTK